MTDFIARQMARDLVGGYVLSGDLFKPETTIGEIRRFTDQLAAAIGNQRGLALRSIASTLADRYRDDPVATAELCDETLDRSGALLGYLREIVANQAKEAKDSEAGADGR